MLICSAGCRHTWEKVVGKNQGQGDHEEFEARDPGRAGIVSSVQHVEIGSDDQVVWPDHGRRPDEQTSGQTRKTEAPHLRCQYKQYREAMKPWQSR
jgi:hypothetical protein